MNHVDRKEFLQIATGKLNATNRFIPESISSIRFEQGQDGTIGVVATSYGSSDGVQNGHAIHEFSTTTTLGEVLEVFASSPNAILRQLATTTFSGDPHE